MRPILLVAALFLTNGPVPAEEAVLWPKGPPTSSDPPGDGEVVSGSGSVSRVREAKLVIHRPEKPNGAAVLIVPGGGYGTVCMKTEGSDILEHLLPHGITAAVLKYRLPYGKCEVPGDDAMRAMRLLRHRADELAIDPAKIGVWGFSAGGHLAATLVNHAAGPAPDAADPIDRQSSKPDFAILFYPVISMAKARTHAGSRRNLLGATPTPELLAKYSLEKQVGKDHPPTFLLHAADDRAVPLTNSLAYAEALQRQGHPVAFQCFTRGGHGPGAFGKNPSWKPAFETWLKRIGALQGG